MTRRLMIAIVSVTLTALVLAGAGTLVFARIEARRSTQERLREQVAEISDGLSGLQSIQLNDPIADVADDNATRDGELRASILKLMRRILRLDGIYTVVLDDAGATTDPIPGPVRLSDVRAASDGPGVVVSGVRGRSAFALAGVPTRSGRPAVIVVTESVDRELRTAGRWFGWAALIALLLASLVALWLSRRLTGPLRDVEAAAHRIADGQLDARVQEPDADATDELAQLSRAVNQMAGSLQRSKGVEEQFLMSVSHDLRTPLTSIRGFAEAIADGASDDPARSAEIIRSEAARLERLVRDLLELAKLRSTGFTLERQRVDVAGLVADIAAGHRRASQQHGIEIVIDAPDAISIDGDPHRLGQVVANLVENARKFARTTVWVSARTEDGSAVICIDDDGPGIAPADLPHVFERLYVSKHQPVRGESSSGLGLAIVAELVEAHGGTVVAQVAPTGGARMMVRLPLPS